MTLQPGQTLARYCLVEKIGEGGMGVVWRARDIRLERDVALKTLPPELVGSEERRKRFVREAKAAAAVSHPNIAPIFDVGEAGGVVYLAMELVEGRTLRSLATQGPVPLGRTLSIGAQIAEGLGRAHREGIVHRDIKPENVIVDDSGHAKILDFGLAKLRGAREEDLAGGSDERETVDALTKEGQTVGTVPYMSPEQTRGKPTDGRSDIFSLGVVLYELLTGRLPFKRGTEVDTMAAILNEAPPAPSSLNPEIGSRLSELLGKCLQKDPARRYQSAADLANDLRSLAAGSETSFQAAATPPASRIKRSAGTAAAVAAVAVIAAWLVSRTMEEAGREPATSAGSTAPAAGERGNRIESIAVLPLDDFSPGEAERYFADGMTEALIAEIAQVSELRVISRTSVMQYRENRPPLPEIAAALGVDAVVEGSVLHSGGKVRIIAQLIQAADDRHLWAGTYERDHEDVLALQRDVATAVAGEIRGALRPGAPHLKSAARRIDPEAHVLYLRGQQSIDEGTEEAIREGLAQFEAALKIDPAYAMAWVGISRAWGALANVYVAPRKAMPQAKAAALRALALDPALAEAWDSLSTVQGLFEWNEKASNESMERALSINPNLPGGAVSLAFDAAVVGDRERVRAMIRKARGLDPLSYSTAMASTWAFITARDYEHALEFVDELPGRFPWLDEPPGMERGTILSLSGRPEEAVAAAERVVKEDESILGLAFLAWTQALAGRRQAALETLARQETISAAGYNCPYETAIAWAALEEYEQAEALFEQGIEERAICWVARNTDPRTDPLRTFDWFQALVARVTPMGPDDPDFVPIPEELGLGSGR